MRAESGELNAHDVRGRAKGTGEDVVVYLTSELVWELEKGTGNLRVDKRLRGCHLLR